ncbi:MAG TPA: amidase family protein, partial [Rubrivivax sp.]|nr:amidase family protein [Rubrivivax sp.]
MPTDTVTDLGACALGRALQRRELSSRELMQAYLDRIARLNPAVNALVGLRPADELLREADARDAERARGEPCGPLHGFPLAIKDLSPVAGMVTTMGSPLLRQFRPDHDSAMVARMKAAGAVLIGRSNVPEFGLGSHTYNPVYGITRNAWDPARSAGGSSGGAAAALALRLQPVADGSDMMGSLRNP